MGVPWCLACPQCSWGVHGLIFSDHVLLAFAADVCTSCTFRSLLLSLIKSCRGGGWGDFAADPASCSFPLVLQNSFHWRFDPDSHGPPAVLALLKGHPSGDHCCQAFSSLDVNVRGACGTWLRNTKSFSPTLTLFLLTLSPSSLHNPPERWEPRFPLLPSMVRRAPHIITS